MEPLDKTIFEKTGVFIHTTIAKADEDALIGGKILFREKRKGRFIEWKQDLLGEPRDGDWTMLDTVSYKNDKDSQVVQLQNTPPAAAAQNDHEGQKYIIDFDITDLKSIKRSKPNLGWSYLIFILKDGTTYPALHFHQGGTKDLIKELEKYLSVKRSPNDSCLYLVREYDPKALTKSFDELHLFEEQSKDITSRFLHDPYRTTMSGFSRVTGLLKDILLAPEQHSAPQINDLLMADEFSGLGLITTNEEEVPEFEVVLQRELPPLQPCQRGDPVSPQLWSHHMDKDGRVCNRNDLLDAIFRGGIEPLLRTDAWKFLLGYYQWDSTYQSRTEQRKKNVDKYFAMKLQWKSVNPEQKKRYSIYRERENLIDKDVSRTDRSHKFFQGENNPNLQVLYDILFTYCMYNFDLGYVQGMSDLLAPILVVMEHEVDAFWCFAGFMDIMQSNFELDQSGMKKQLSDLHKLIRILDPHLSNHFESHDSGNMFFCFRWVLIWFKREFTFPDIMRLWEVLWTSKPCTNFHMLICCAILDDAKATILDNNFGFTEILKHINDLSGAIDLNDTINKAEGIYKQLRDCKNLPNEIAEIIGLHECNTSRTGKAPSPSTRSCTPSPPQAKTPLYMASSSESPSPKTSPKDQLRSLEFDSSIEVLTDPHM